MQHSEGPLSDSALQNNSPMQHSEDPSLLTVDTTGCPAAVVQELQQFQYRREYHMPANAMLPDTQGCSCVQQCGNDCSCVVECSKGLQALKVCKQSN